jgi:glycine cleavage system H protein
MDFPGDRIYSEYHLWVKLERNHAAIGITAYAGEELGDVDYIELPQPDDIIARNAPFGTIETSKAVTDLIAPISGIVLESNTALSESPEAVTDDPYGDGWLVVVEASDPDELEELMDALRPGRTRRAYGRPNVRGKSPYRRGRIAN